MIMFADGVPSSQSPVTSMKGARYPARPSRIAASCTRRCPDLINRVALAIIFFIVAPV